MRLVVGRRCGDSGDFFLAREHAAQERRFLFLLIGCGCGLCVGAHCVPEFFGTFFAVNIDIFLHHPAVGAEYAENAVAGIFDAVAVAYAYCPVDTAVLLARVIVDRAGREAAVGDDNGLVVAGGDNGVEYLDFVNGARIALGLDEIADFIRLEKQYEHAAGKVLQGAAQGHAYGDAGRGENGDERRCLDAEYADYYHYHDEIQHYAHHAQYEGGKRAVELAALENSADEIIQLVDNQPADIEDDNGDCQINGKSHHGVDELVDKFVERQRFEHRCFFFD